jgi:hypothetical protein
MVLKFPEKFRKSFSLVCIVINHYILKNINVVEKGKQETVCSIALEIMLEQYRKNMQPWTLGIFFNSMFFPQ